MKNDWLTTDLVSLLCLDQAMTPAEVSDFIGVLEKEIWYRVLEEELPKVISKSDYTFLAQNMAGKTDFNSLITYIKENLPLANIEQLIEDSTLTVKKEFAKSYIQSLTEQNSKDWEEIERAVKEMETESPNFEVIKAVCQKFLISPESSTSSSE